MLDRLHADLDELIALDFEPLTTPERLHLLDRIEQVRRRLPAGEHALINQLANQATPAELGYKLPTALALRLRISRREANRRIGDAADLGARRALTGEPLAPVLPATAAAQRAGEVGPESVAVIRNFYRRLPVRVDPAERDSAEADLAGFAGEFPPEEVSNLAAKLESRLNPDGNYTDEDRARRRGVVMGRQDVDGMSRITGYLTPQARAGLEAVFARWAAPGMCNPADEAPTLDGTPPQQAIRSDRRSLPQRNHDALDALCRALLCSGELGRHNGLPAAIVASATLAELEAGVGHGLTAGGSLLPMGDVIRMARHAHHYLAIFHNGKAIGLCHTKRLASPGQRIVLHAKDRGCSFPGCAVPGYLCEAHHTDEYANCGSTDVNDLTWCCGTHHELTSTGGWTTRKRRDGETEWIPPAHLDYGQSRVNSHFHPEKLLRHNQTEADDDHAA